VNHSPVGARQLSRWLPALLLAWAGCEGASPQPPQSRAAQEPAIIEEVLRYAVRQFVREDPAGLLCLGVRDGGTVRDPEPSALQRLSLRDVTPISSCQATRTLLIGPVDWLRDDEVRVKGSYRRGDIGETRLAYRVVREHDRWVCVGPIISLDPL